MERTATLEKGNSLGAYFLMLLVPLFWGGAFPAAQHVVTELPPITTAAIRFMIAGSIMWIILMLSADTTWNTVFESVKQHWAGLLMMALTGVFAYNLFYYIAMQYTSAINGSLIIATNPIFTTLGAILILKEPWSRRLGMGMFLSFFGVLLVLSNGSLQRLLSLSFNRGDLLLLVSLFSWVAYGLIGKVVMEGVSPLVTTTVTTMVGACLLFIFSFFEDGWVQLPLLSFQSWVELLYMSLFATVIAFFLWNKGVHEVGASRASLFINLVPINATWIAVLIYGDFLLWQQGVGMLMVIGGVMLAISPRGKKRGRKGELAL